MSDLARQLAELSFTKQHFLSSVRAGCEGMLKMLGEELWEIYQGELMDLVMAIYEKEYPVYFDVQVEILDELYTPEQQADLLLLHTTHPWLSEKATEVNKRTVEKNQPNSMRLMEIVGTAVVDFMEGREGRETCELAS